MRFWRRRRRPDISSSEWLALDHSRSYASIDRLTRGYAALGITAALAAEAMRAFEYAWRVMHDILDPSPFAFVDEPLTRTMADIARGR